MRAGRLRWTQRTFLVSAAFLSRVHPARTGRRSRRAARTRQRVGVWESIREGAREVRSRTWVWATLASFCVALFFGLASWFVLGADRRPGAVRPLLGVYGFVEAAIGFGTIIGSVVGVGWRPRYPMRLAMLATLLWPLSRSCTRPACALFVVIPATVLGGAGFALFDVWWLTALAERIPPHALSRVTSYDWMVSLGLMPLGYAWRGRSPPAWARSTC